LGKLPLLLLAALPCLLVIAACTDSASYSKPDLTVRGDTNSDRILSIAEAVGDDHDGFVAVPQAEITLDESGRQANYLVMITVSEEDYLETPETQAEADRQSEAQEHVNSALADLLRLSVKHLVAHDVTLQAVAIRLLLPDGSVFDGIADVAALKSIADDAPEGAYLDAISISQQVIVPAQLWEQLLAESGVSAESGGQLVP